MRKETNYPEYVIEGLLVWIWAVERFTEEGRSKEGTPPLD
jgi:hypothetical protein